MENGPLEAILSNRALRPTSVMIKIDRYLGSVFCLPNGLPKSCAAPSACRLAFKSFSPKAYRRKRAKSASFIREPSNKLRAPANNVDGWLYDAVCSRIGVDQLPGPMAQSSTHSAASSMAKLEDGGTILAMNSKSAGM